MESFTLGKIIIWSSSFEYPPFFSLIREGEYQRTYILVKPRTVEAGKSYAEVGQEEILRWKKPYRGEVHFHRSEHSDSKNAEWGGSEVPQSFRN